MSLSLNLTKQVVTQKLVREFNENSWISVMMIYFNQKNTLLMLHCYE